MKKAVVVRCKHCQHEWGIRESRTGEFGGPITVTCPQCKVTYKNIDYHTLYIGKVTTFTMLRPKLASLKPRVPVRVSFPIIIFIIIFIILVISICSYIMFHP